MARFVRRYLPDYTIVFIFTFFSGFFEQGTLFKYNTTDIIFAVVLAESFAWLLLVYLSAFILTKIDTIKPAHPQTNLECGQAILEKATQSPISKTGSVLKALLGVVIAAIVLYAIYYGLTHFNFSYALFLFGLMWAELRVLDRKGYFAEYE